MKDGHLRMAIFLENAMDAENVIPLKTKNEVIVDPDQEISKILSTIEDNFLNGSKSIAFGSTQYKNSQGNLLVLSADYFHKKYPNLKILIITFDLKFGAVADLIKFAKNKSNYLYAYSRNISILDWRSIFKGVNYPQSLVDEYDMVFWDLPELGMVTEKANDLRSSFEAMDALYLVGLKHNKFDDEQFKRDIFKFYDDHGLDIRTILPWLMGAKKRKPRSRVSRFFYDLFHR